MFGTKNVVWNKSKTMVSNKTSFKASKKYQSSIFFQFYYYFNSKSVYTGEIKKFLYLIFFYKSIDKICQQIYYETSMIRIIKQTLSTIHDIFQLNDI